MESDLGISITQATLTAAHLVALYQDDAADICEFVGIECVQTRDQYRPLFWETASAYAGHGFGLCEHCQNRSVCLRERRELPERNILAVHYSKTALTVGLTWMQWATLLWEPDYRHQAYFNLGSGAIDSYDNAEQYWNDVSEALISPMRIWENPDMVLLTGDEVADDGFLGRLN
jgi:hypothetical protein